MKLEAIILAAGQGTRMKSALPKVLHPIAGKPMLFHIIDCARQLNIDRIHVVIGHGAELVKKAIDTDDINWVIQAEQNGTGHAVQQVMPAVDPDSQVVILNGDAPLIRTSTLQPLTRTQQLSLLTATMDNPTGLGRILRNDENLITAIVEEKDASEAQRKITEINTNYMSAPAQQLSNWLNQLDSNNAQGELYLTDIIALAVKDGIEIHGHLVNNTDDILGINNRSELARAERIAQSRQAEKLMQNGTTLIDPARLDIRGNCNAGQDCLIDVNVILEGDVELGDGVTIGANSIIRNSRIGDHVSIEANCIIEQASIGSDCAIGPFARIRPQAVLEDGARIGNFVEIKKSRIGKGSKVNHLSYVGDSDVGDDVNIGAGVITCNYDGANKHQTNIGNHVFVGSDCQLVAPVNIADNVTIGAGSTITQDVADGELAISRGKQRNIKGWKRPVKS